MRYHEPVMVQAVVRALHIKKLGSYIDATLGTGGHALEIVRRAGELLGIEMDPAMLVVAERRLKEVCPTPNRDGLGSFKLALGNFRQIGEIAKENGFGNVDGILFDLGVSNLQLTGSARGFSFNNPKATLDMRIDPERQGVKASDLINGLRKDQLVDLFATTMGLGASARLSEAIVRKRKEGPVVSVGDLLGLVEKTKKGDIHPATLPFLSLRIAVNSELDNLKEALPKAYELLRTGGKLAVISFHSGEDAIVKDFGGDKPIFPSQEEVLRNPRARSAKLRVITRV